MVMQLCKFRYVTQLVFFLVGIFILSILIAQCFRKGDHRMYVFQNLLKQQISNISQIKLRIKDNIKPCNGKQRK